MEKEKLVSRVTLLMYCYVHQLWGQPPWLLIQVLSLTIFLIWGKVINHCGSVSYSSSIGTQYMLAGVIIIIDVYC